MGDIIPHANTLARLAPLADQARMFLEAAKSPNTRRAYAADWRKFQAWCVELELQPLPPDPATVLAYLTALAAQGRKVVTVERAMVGLAFGFRANGHKWTTPEIITETLKGMRNELGTRPEKKAPAVDHVFRAMIATFGDDLRGARNRALLAMGWTGAFRRSEVVSLDVRDVTFDPEGLVVLLRKSKTDQEGKGVEKGLPPSSDVTLCPVFTLRAWLRASCITSGPIFRPFTPLGNLREMRLSDHAVAEIIKRAASDAGLDPTIYSGHSLRSGFMTTAGRDGVQLYQIMRQSGHASERVAREYVRHATLFQNNAAKGLL
jgi:integrase